jgi:light-regulated signal transduction histidine kinase (bacteriophytochrome)
MDAFSDGISRPGHVTHDDGHVEEHGPVSILLDDLGMIVDCCQGSERLFGFHQSELVSQHISKLFPQLSQFQLLSNGHLNSLLDYLCHCGTFFLTKNRHGRIFNSELHFVELLDHGPMRIIRLIVSPFFGESDELYAFTS